MIFTLRGWKAIILILGILFLAMLFLIFLFKLLWFLLPLLIVLFLISYLFKMLNKLKKDKPTDIIDIPFRIKK
tara:strand:- start:40047 stop:40265 length:219 start_codon:yes stop_codon:yes gene_type:complete